MRPRRYPSDTTEAEWALIEPLLPTPAAETALFSHPPAFVSRSVRARGRSAAGPLLCAAN